MTHFIFSQIFCKERSKKSTNFSNTSKYSYNFAFLKFFIPIKNWNKKLYKSSSSKIAKPDFQV